MVNRDNECCFCIADSAHDFAHSSRFGVVGFFLDVEGSRDGIDKNKPKPYPEFCFEMFGDSPQIANKGLQTVRLIKVRNLLDPRNRNVPFNSKFFHCCRNAGAQHSLSFGSHNDRADSYFDFMPEKRLATCSTNSNQDCNESFARARLAADKWQSLQRHGRLDQNFWRRG